MPAKPSSVIVVGAGIIGLTTAWFLQEEGVDVTVLDQQNVAAGSSSGNAGWVTPGLISPLADPHFWRHGIRALTDRRSPLKIPLRLDPSLVRFLTAFSLRGTSRTWSRSLRHMVPLAAHVFPAFEALSNAGATAPVSRSDIAIAFDSARERDGFIHELGLMRAAGQETEWSAWDDWTTGIGCLSEKIHSVIRLRDQGFVDPGRFARDLALSVVARGGRVLAHHHVRAVEPHGQLVHVRLVSGETLTAESAVIATGAWLPQLAKELGVRMPFAAGRGYSFHVRPESLPRTPIYFPSKRVACTPIGRQLRVAGTMEFLSPDAPLNPRRVEDIIVSVSTYLQGIDFQRRRDDWVGARPITSDGLPLVGQTQHPRVFVAGGHGMWGVVLGPATSRLLASVMTGSNLPRELVPLDPLR